jgi:hypothetical protein
MEQVRLQRHASLGQEIDGPLGTRRGWNLGASRRCCD